MGTQLRTFQGTLKHSCTSGCSYMCPSCLEHQYQLKCDSTRSCFFGARLQRIGIISEHVVVTDVMFPMHWSNLPQEHCSSWSSMHCAFAWLSPA